MRDMDTVQENRFVLDTDWEGYLKISEVVGERPIRVTYDRGKLEIMTVSYEHEQMKSILKIVSSKGVAVLLCERKSSQAQAIK